MDQLLALPLNLLRMLDLTNTDESVLNFASIEDITANALSGLLSTHELQRMTHTLRDMNDRDTGFTSMTDRIDDVTSLLRKAVDSEQVSAKTTAINKTFDELFALWSMLHARVIGYADIILTHADMFNYIDRICIEPDSDQPSTLIIGSHDTSVSLSLNNYIARKTEIIYSNASQYPTLNIKTPSKRPRAVPSAVPKHTRFDWLQRSSEEYDLEVYNFQERLVGSISTRELELPQSVRGKRHHLTIPAHQGTKLSATSIRDVKGVLLLRCLRVVTT